DPAQPPCRSPPAFQTAASQPAQSSSGSGFLGGGGSHSLEWRAYRQRSLGRGVRSKAPNRRELQIGRPQLLQNTRKTNPRRAGISTTAILLRRRRSQSSTKPLPARSG